MAVNTVVPTPPRPTGDQANDFKALFDWVAAFYRATVIESGLLDPNFQGTEDPAFDANNLPEPSDTSIAKAQQTANAAITALLAHSLYP